MSSLLVALSKQAQTLSQSERAQLVENLLLSLENELEPDAEAAWTDEILRRVQDVEEGTADLV